MPHFKHLAELSVLIILPLESTFFFDIMKANGGIQLYLSGILSVDEAVARLRYNKVNNQVSFHTPLALEHLVFESRKDV